MDTAELVSIRYFPTNDNRKQHESATRNLTRCLVHGSFMAVHQLHQLPPHEPGEV